ncbi:thioredoxin [Roseimicrobium gellanilyticum]|uniref:Thioredoxin n=1 Tax=Roseimicrobium gellanilyticum TaxID=748857 RepID=A0A366H7C2_9BACT|nr:thioredoxin domain-containing protein [Roseimicrobium gellanilyticum]RBP37405.1 thioredoxin [Roseimicrobium gellanilyticum]
MITLSDANFEAEVGSSSLPVIVDVWGENCGSCRVMEPVLKQISDEREGQIKVCKMNLYDSPQTGLRFNIRALPTFLFFKGGELVARHSGSMSKDGLLRIGGLL